MSRSDDHQPPSGAFIELLDHCALWLLLICTLEMLYLFAYIWQFRDDARNTIEDSYDVFSLIQMH